MSTIISSQPRVPNPVNPLDVANKAYVDSATGGGGGVPYLLQAIYFRERVYSSNQPYVPAWGGTFDTASVEENFGDVAPIPDGFIFQIERIRAVATGATEMTNSQSMNLTWYAANVRSNQIAAMTLQGRTGQPADQTTTDISEFGRLTHDSVFMVQMNAQNNFNLDIILQAWGKLTIPTIEERIEERIEEQQLSNIEQPTGTVQDNLATGAIIPMTPEQAQAQAPSPKRRRRRSRRHD